jgi:hypothetical protein
VASLISESLEKNGATIHHGSSLKRMELGNKLQGLDYVYTIGGMLKSINNPYSNLTNLDPGMDGYATGANANVSPDLFRSAAFAMLRN